MGGRVPVEEGSDREGVGEATTDVFKILNGDAV